jgi:hypothetical protein
MTEIEWKMLTIVHTKMYESNNTTKGKTAQFQTAQKENNPSCQTIILILMNM